MAFEVRTATLSNGLTILAEVDPAAHTAAAGFFVRTGARDEPTPIMGVSHFLEHMMFKGSEKRGALQVNEDFDRIGASHNAFTSGEMTCFHAHVLPEHLGEAVGMLADILRPALRQADFDEEKGVILEEIAMYEDNPFMALYEAMMERYYVGHPMGHRVLGTKETVGGMQRDAMDRYFHDRYASDTMALAVAGRVDFDALVREVEGVCGKWPRGTPGRSHPSFTPKPCSFDLSLPNLSRAYLGMMMPAPALNDPRRYASSLVAQIVGDSEGSRFYWSLVETGLAEEATCNYEGRDGLGEYLVLAACPKEGVPEVKARMLEEMDRLAGSLEQAELDRAKARIAPAVALAGERPAGRMTRLGSLWAYGIPYATLDEEMVRIDRIGLDDLRRSLAEFPLKPVVTGLLTS
ncbi:MAG: M16 family metallopeptidase [Planctomycetota bacterium]